MATKDTKVVTQENKVKLGGVVLWSQAYEVETEEKTKLTVHKYLIRNTTLSKNDKALNATFSVESWQGLTPSTLWAKGTIVELVGKLAINYVPAVYKTGKNKGEPIMVKGSDDKDYQKRYENVIIRAESIVESLPF